MIGNKLKTLKKKIKVIYFYYVKELSSFIYEYKKLSILALFSFLIVLFYTFTTNVPELFEFGEELLFLLFSISIAILSNYVFCFFQLFLPKYHKYLFFEKKIIDDLNQIKLHLATPIEKIYMSKYGKSKVKIDEIDDNCLSILINGFDLFGIVKDMHFVNNANAYRYINLLLNSKNDANEYINKLLLRYNDIIGFDLIKLLYQIQDSSYFKAIDMLPVILTSTNPVVSKDIKPYNINSALFNFKEVKEICDKIDKKYKSFYKNV